MFLWGEGGGVYKGLILLNFQSLRLQSISYLRFHIEPILILRLLGREGGRGRLLLTWGTNYERIVGRMIPVNYYAHYPPMFWGRSTSPSLIALHE